MPRNVMEPDRALLAFAEWSERHEGVPPTVREFADECGLVSTSAASRWLVLLEERGLLRHAVPERGYAQANDLVLTALGRALVARLRMEGVAA